MRVCDYKPNGCDDERCGETCHLKPTGPTRFGLRLYVAGKMSGEPEHGFPAFRAATKTLREMGHEVISPVEMDESEGFDATTASDVTPGSEQWCNFLSRDVLIVASPDIDAIVVLDGWERSRGAALEVHVARELGKPIYRLAQTRADISGYDWGLEPVKAPTKYQPPSDERPLEEALRLVHGDRGQDYGHPGDDFARTAGMWRALFGWDVEPRDVAVAMVCVKLSRLRETPGKRDSVTDIAGYAETYWMVVERERSAT